MTRSRDAEPPARRAEVIGVGGDVPAGQTDVRVEPDATGVVRVHSAGEDLGPATSPTIIQGYERENPLKPIKITAEAPLRPGLIIRSTTEALLSYRILLAVDTNSFTTGGRLISITSVLMVQVRHIPEGRQLHVADPRHAVSIDANVPPERYGWYLALRLLHAVPGFTAQHDVALIVDSHHAEHAALNRREVPLFGGIFLPPGTDLHYASADAGVHLLGPKLMRMCDSMSRDLRASLDFSQVGRARPRGDGEAAAYVAFLNPTPERLKVWEERFFTLVDRS